MTMMRTSSSLSSTTTMVTQRRTTQKREERDRTFVISSWLYYFSFGDEEPVEVTKSEEEKILDELWADFELVMEAKNAETGHTEEEEEKEGRKKCQLPDVEDKEQLIIVFEDDEDKDAEDDEQLIIVIEDDDDEDAEDEEQLIIDNNNGNTMKDNTKDGGARQNFRNQQLPLLFSFGDEESVQVAKSKEEKMLDELWADFELGMEAKNAEIDHPEEEEEKQGRKRCHLPDAEDKEQLIIVNEYDEDEDAEDEEQLTIDNNNGNTMKDNTIRMYHVAFSLRIPRFSNLFRF